jgi:hypothetical protein
VARHIRKAHPGTSVALTLLAWAAVNLGAQAVTVNRVADAVAVRAPGFTFIKGEPLARLKDGVSVRTDLDLSVLSRPGGPAAAHNRQTFVLSYDLWEERFAVTLAGPPSKSVAYLTSTAAEAWCLAQLTIPAVALGSLGRGVPFWIRLEYRMLGGDRPSEEDAGLTLRALIDAFSARRKAAEWTHTLEAGPFKL